MSKVNRRKEIQEKEAFQLKFQLALSKNNKHVLNWLPTSKSSRNGLGAEDEEKFMGLPIIENGQGLFSIDNDKSDQFHTLGDFLKSETLQGKQDSVASKDQRSGSKAMSALMNKMRTDKRKSLVNEQDSRLSGSRPAQKIHKPFKKSEIMAAIKKPTKKISKHQIADDSDEEESKMSQISEKKKVLQTGKKGKARPF